MHVCGTKDIYHVAVKKPQLVALEKYYKQNSGQLYIFLTVVYSKKHYRHSLIKTN